MQVIILQADQRPKQNHKDVLLPTHSQKLFLLGKELGLILNHKNIRSLIIQCRRRKYLRLQADPKLKQNREDLQLLVHLEGLYPFWKESGLMLVQELNPIKRTQWQKD